MHFLNFVVRGLVFRSKVSFGELPHIFDFHDFLLSILVHLCFKIFFSLLNLVNTVQLLFLQIMLLALDLFKEIILVFLYLCVLVLDICLISGNSIQH